jgi:hypothetical protein
MWVVVLDVTRPRSFDFDRLCSLGRIDLSILMVDEGAEAEAEGAEAKAEGATGLWSTPACPSTLSSMYCVGGLGGCRGGWTRALIGGAENCIVIPAVLHQVALLMFLSLPGNPPLSASVPTLSSAIRMPSPGTLYCFSTLMHKR